MKIYFSSQQTGFYVDNASDIPEDATEVNADIYDQFMGVPWPEGKMLGTDNEGMPAWVDAPPPTQEELIRTAETDKQKRIDAANQYINYMQWPSKLALNRLSANEKGKFNEWLDYLDALEAVNTSSAPEIDWPAVPEVPAA